MPNLPRSVAIHLRPSFSATAAVVPLPQKKSATRSPSLLLALKYSFEQSFRLLGAVTHASLACGIDRRNIDPEVLRGLARHFVQDNASSVECAHTVRSGNTIGLAVEFFHLLTINVSSRCSAA